MTALDTSRRAFLSARFQGDDPAVMRPPGNIGSAFRETCTRCDACLAACPQAIVAKDDRGFPVLRLDLAACTFCGACAEACDTGALDLARIAEWPWRARISPACLSLRGVSCRACQDTCEPEAIRFRPMLGGRAEPVLDPEHCTGCGACAAICPAGAVSFTRLESWIQEATA